ncbi:MAG: hypothetical protein M3O31_12050 [Acidobacteriota bacterium]|nr:hypothetical protein [Acidobacteriota bacterium]
MPSEYILAPPERPSQRIASNLMLALAGLWCIYWFIHARYYWEDDAYIHLEFARSVSNGLGFSFNGHVVAGDTAPLWVWMLTAMHAVIPNWLMAGKVLAAVGAVFGLTGAYMFARKLAASLLPPSVARIFPSAMVLLIVANPYTCYWIFSGMEPITAAGVAFFAVLSATPQRPSAASFLTGCLFAGIAPLLRPEMIFFTALLAFALLGQWSRLRSKTVSFVSGLLLICGPVALWSLYSLHAFGHLIPNTNAAKRAAPTDSVVHRLLSIYSAGLPLILCGLLAGIVYIVLRPSSVRRSIKGAISSAFGRSTDSQQDAAGLPLAGWIFILWPLIASIFYVADHTYVQTRYILVTAPGLTIVIMALFLRASLRTGRVVYAAALIAALAVSIVTVRPFLRNKGLMCLATDGFANFMRNQIPPNDPVAAYAIGQIAFVSEHPIIDTGGITRPGVIPYLNSPSDRLRWAKSEGAQYIIDDHQPEPGATNVYTGQLPFIGWTFHASRYATFSKAEIWKLAPSAERALPPLTSVLVKP